MLQRVGNALLRFGDTLLTACCCTIGKICVPEKDECGNAVSRCVDAEQGEPECPPECAATPPPCECGPDKQCPVCYECIERRCERIQDCCLDGEPCPACSECINGVCVPCGECTQCINGFCFPCGPCEKCEGGECVGCDAGEVCIDGVCVPKKYYCCWNSCADKLLNNNNTTCKAAIVSGSGQADPCGADNTTGGCGSLTKSGPHATAQLCSQECQRYKCAPDACGNNQCVPDANGPYPSRSACLAACGDPCAGPCAFAGGSAPGVYSIDGCEREICVSYSSLRGRPIRVQIWGPIMDNGCPVPGSRVIKTDSDWRGDQCCDCPAARNGGSLKGGPKGQITWNKPEGATWFEVAVLFPCANGSSYELDILCDGDCADLTEPDRCPCAVNADCANDCPCVQGTCGCDCTNCSSLVWSIDQGDLDPTCAYQHPEFGEVIGFDANYSGSSIFATNPLQSGVIPGGWKTGYPAALGDRCLRWVLDEAGCPQPCHPSPVWWLTRRVRLFAYDCVSKTMEDVTSEALEGPYSETMEGCGQGDVGNPLPFNDAVPTVACNQLP